MSSEYLKRIRKSRHDSELVHYPFECRNGIAGYPEKVEKEMLDFVYSKVTNYISRDKVFL